MHIYVIGSLQILLYGLYYALGWSDRDSQIYNSNIDQKLPIVSQNFYKKSDIHKIRLNLGLILRFFILVPG